MTLEPGWLRSDLLPPIGGFFSCVVYILHMSNTVDFEIIESTQVPGISLVIAQNEDAYAYLEDEDMTILKNGSAVIDTDRLGDFISDAGWEHYSSALV